MVTFMLHGCTAARDRQTDVTVETVSKTFDAVEMSRRLREQTGRKLWAMSPAQRRSYLNEATERYRAEIRARNARLENQPAE